MTDKIYPKLPYAHPDSDTDCLELRYFFRMNLNSFILSIH